MSATSPVTRAPAFGADGETSRDARHSGQSYWLALRRAALVACVVHFGFGALFLALDATLMVWANLGSIALYALAHRLLSNRRNLVALAVMWSEVMLHAVAATVGVGWDSGFHYYMLLMMPLVFISPGRLLARKIVIGSVLAVFYIGLDAFAHRHAPLHAVAPTALSLLRGFNIATTLALLAYLAHVYLGAVRRAEGRLRDLASTDALTGLANRRRLLQVAQAQLGRRRRDGTPISFILGDIDHFKAINDRLGHDVGDRALVRAARAILSATRDSDIAGRWGGEEFLVVLPDTDLDSALKVAERVRAAVQQITLAPLLPPMSITLGVSSLRDGESLEETISRADAAMYRGKMDGRNRCVAEAPAGSAHG